MARDYLKGRGLNEEICREFRLGLALGGTTLARKALEKGFTREELRAAGLTRQRGDDYFQRRLLFPLADRQGRVLGFQARKLHEDDPLPAEVREHARVGALPQGRDRLRARQGARVDRARGPGLRRRGEHRRDRAAAGRVRAGGRLDGHRAHRAAAEGARAADEAPLARLRRRCRRRDGHAARDGARRQAGVRREGGRAAGRHRPGRRSAWLRAAARRRRAVSALPRADRARARGGP